MQRLDCAYEVFGGDATNVDAGAADSAVTNERHLHTLFSSRDRGRKSGGPGTDDGEIIAFLGFVR